MPEKFVPGQIEIPRTEAVKPTEASISYLGVELPKADPTKRSEYVPDPEKYADFTVDRFEADLMRDIAESFSANEPCLLEGGTSLGKTTTVVKMCAELGYEVHYINLNGNIDVEALMGRYTPNPHKRNRDDQEFIFADGPVTRGLRIQAGKSTLDALDELSGRALPAEQGVTKVIILDEINFARTEVLNRLHEVLDALKHNSTVTLSEGASEIVQTDHAITKIVGISNPPGGEFIGREGLDPALLRRWNYRKLPSELPQASTDSYLDSLFGLQPASETISVDMILSSRPDTLLPEQLAQIDGIEQILARYSTFHQAAKSQVAEHQLGADQHQRFSYDDREEPRRVRDFIARHFNGDITETMQQALYYYYVGKLESSADRDRLMEQVRLVEYTPESSSKRRDLGGEDQGDDTEVQTSSGETISSAEARAIMGERMLDFSATAELVAKFTSAESDPLPESLRDTIPFSRAELEAARELGGYLIAQPALSLAELKAGQDALAGKLFYNQDWYDDEEFIHQTPRAGWRLIIPEVAGSESKNYLEQTDLLLKTLQDQLEGGTIPAKYQAAIEQFTAQRDAIARLLNEDNWQEAGRQLAELELTTQLRPSAAEVFWQMAVISELVGTRLHNSDFIWTSSLTSGSLLVDVGYFDAFGASVHRSQADGRRDYLVASLQLS